MFGIGFGEMLVIGVLILIAVGPDKLPVMVKTVAKTYRQFRRAATDIRASTGLDDFLRDEELKELAELRKQKLMMLTESKPAIAGKPVVSKPIVSKPGVPAAAGAMAGEGESIPATKTIAAKTPGLTLKQRLAEVPPQGVDVAEAEVSSIPPTRTDGPASPSSPATSPTEKA